MEKFLLSVHGPGLFMIFTVSLPGHVPGCAPRMTGIFDQGEISHGQCGVSLLSQFSQAPGPFLPQLPSEILKAAVIVLSSSDSWVSYTQSPLSNCS